MQSEHSNLSIQKSAMSEANKIAEKYFWFDKQLNHEPIDLYNEYKIYELNRIFKVKQTH